jgi:hypothetical protein
MDHATDPRWADTTVLSAEVASATGERRAEPAAELQVHGSGNLVRWLFDKQLVDEITLLLSRGHRPGHAAVSHMGPDTALELVHSKSTPTSGDDPGLPAHRATAVHNCHARLKHLTDVPLPVRARALQHTRPCTRRRSGASCAAGSVAPGSAVDAFVTAR